MPELQARWHERMSPEARAAIAELHKRIGGEAEPADTGAVAKAMDHAIGHVFARESVVPERKVLTAALKHAVGNATPEQVLQHAKTVPFIRGKRHGREMVTTHEVRAEEKHIIDFARSGRGTCRKISANDNVPVPDWLSAEQKNAIRHVLSSRDKVMVIRGAAGAGKTTLMKEAATAIRASGIGIVAVAPTTGASRGVLKEAGFEDATTVAMLLKDQELQQKAKGQLIWMDEAGQVGTKTMKQVIELAERLNARLLLTGDKKQHGSVERGSVLSLLESEAGIVPAEVKEIRRQTGAYKHAIEHLSEGRMGQGFKMLQDLGWVIELPHEERYLRMASDYVDFIAKDTSALVISPTHSEGDRITAEIRRQLAEKKALGKERRFTVLENANFTDPERADQVNYQPGDVLQFHQNATGFTRGQRFTVDMPESVPVHFAERFNAFHQKEIAFREGDRIRITHNGHDITGKHRLNNGDLHTIRRFSKNGGIVLENGWTIAQDFGHFTHGYVVTSYASQGKSVHRVFIGQSSESFAASSREQFYVSASRGSREATIYTDDAAELCKHIADSDERLSATEFIKPRRHIEPPRAPERQPTRELEYER